MGGPRRSAWKKYCFVWARRSHGAVSTRATTAWSCPWRLWAASGPSTRSPRSPQPAVTRKALSPAAKAPPLADWCPQPRHPGSRPKAYPAHGHRAPLTRKTSGRGGTLPATDQTATRAPAPSSHQPPVAAAPRHEPPGSPNTLPGNKTPTVPTATHAPLANPEHPLTLGNVARTKGPAKGPTKGPPKGPKVAAAAVEAARATTHEAVAPEPRQPSPHSDSHSSDPPFTSLPRAATCQYRHQH